MSNSVCFLAVVRHLPWSPRRITFRSIRFPTLAILWCLAAAAFHPGLLAQNICGATPPAYPCLDQPTDAKITGRLTAVGVAPPAGSTVKLEIGSTKIGVDVRVQPDGSFSFDNPGGLKRLQRIKGHPSSSGPYGRSASGKHRSRPHQIARSRCKALRKNRTGRVSTNRMQGTSDKLTGSLTTDTVRPACGRRDQK